jgi:hypothetical protein
MKLQVLEYSPGIQAIAKQRNPEYFEDDKTEMKKVEDKVNTEGQPEK